MPLLLDDLISRQHRAAVGQAAATLSPGHPGPAIENNPTRRGKIHPGGYALTAGGQADQDKKEKGGNSSHGERAKKGGRVLASDQTASGATWSTFRFQDVNSLPILAVPPMPKSRSSTALKEMARLRAPNP